MIEVSHITKKFTDFTVLEDICFNVQRGQIYGLIGYNGVGKTTLMKIICGIYRPDSGEVRINGEKVYENPGIKRNCFFMTEETTMFSQETLTDMRKFYKGYYPGWSDRTFEGLIKIFDIDPLMRIKRFSKGMQRQAGLILAFSAHTKCLFLDEAFDGLDFSVRKIVKEMLQYYRDAKDADLIVSSHNLAELEDLADTIGMLKDGTLIFDGSTKQMKDHFQRCRFRRGHEISDVILEGTRDEVEKRLQDEKCEILEIRSARLEEFFQKERKETNIDWKEIF